MSPGYLCSGYRIYGAILATIRLSPRDWNWLLDLMENPSEPSVSLKLAMKRYQEAKSDDVDPSFNWEP